MARVLLFGAFAAPAGRAETTRDPAELPRIEGGVGGNDHDAGVSFGRNGVGCLDDGVVQGERAGEVGQREHAHGVIADPA